MKEIVHPNGGGMILNDLVEMAEGDEELADKVFELSDNYREIQNMMLAEYVKQNDLPVKYYKDSEMQAYVIGE